MICEHWKHLQGVIQTNVPDPDWGLPKEREREERELEREKEKGNTEIDFKKNIGM